MMRVAGIMSGTSLDGIDVAIVEIEGRRVRTVAFRTNPYAPALRKAIKQAQCRPRIALAGYWEATEPHYWQAIGETARLLAASAMRTTTPRSRSMEGMIACG